MAVCLGGGAISLEFVFVIGSKQTATFLYPSLD